MKRVGLFSALLAHEHSRKNCNGSNLDIIVWQRGNLGNSRSRATTTKGGDLFAVRGR